MERHLDAHVARLKAVADTTRLRLLNICLVGEFTVSELTRILGYSQPRVSRHLRTLVDAGLLIRFREQHFVFYRVPSEPAVREQVHAFLSGLDSEDATLAQDQTVIERVLDERDERARDLLARVSDNVRIDPSFSRAAAEQIRAHLDLEGLGNLLDIGTGSGRVLKVLAPYVASAVGIDISSDMLTVARSNLASAGLGNVMVRHGDMYRLPFADGAFDTVTIDNVLSDARWPQRALREAARTLRPGGVMLLIESGPAEHEPALCAGDLRAWMSDTRLGLLGEATVDDRDVSVRLFFAGLNHDAAAA